MVIHLLYSIVLDIDESPWRTVHGSYVKFVAIQEVQNIISDFLKYEHIVAAVKRLITQILELDEYSSRRKAGYCTFQHCRIYWCQRGVVKRFMKDRLRWWKKYLSSISWCTETCVCSWSSFCKFQSLHDQYLSKLWYYEG